MIKKIKPAFLIVINFLLLQNVSGQELMNTTDYLSKKFQNYTASVPREEIYVHSDRNAYISGEDLWFNIYLFDRQSLKQSSGSRIAYFELLNPENRPIVQKKIFLVGGSGPGQINLPDTLSSGTYTLRAYTSWMKNFLPDNCFMKDIRIHNSFSNKTFKGHVKSVSLIAGSTETQSYQSLDEAGISLLADNMKPDILEISVSTNEKFRSENSNLFYLFIDTHGTINRVSSEKISGELTKIYVPKKQLAAGINHITIFNSKGQSVCERFIFTPDNIEQQISIHSADSLGLRNRTIIELETMSRTPTSSNSSKFSVSVAPATNLTSLMDINDYLIFGTEFGSVPGKVIGNRKIKDIPYQQMDSLLQNVKSNWINWNSILADDPPSFKFHAEKENHYLSGKLLTGEKKTADANRFVIISYPGKVPVFQYATTDNDGIFNFKMHIDSKVNDLVVQPDVITKNQSLILESSFSDKYPKYEISRDTVRNPVPDYLSTWSVNNQVRKIYGVSSVGEPLVQIISTSRIKRFYGKPTTELIMKEYIALPVMQEVFFELLVGVFLKNKKTTYEITMADPANNKLYENLPGLFIDGVMVKDASLIAGLDPELVEKIDVVREKYIVGDYMFYGIVNVITKASDLSNITLPDYCIRLPYRIIDPVNQFVSPDYSSSERKRSRIPDFRNTLYWNPSVKTDSVGRAKIEFWTSDFISEYEVNIQGITSEGKSFSYKKIINVKRQ
jgi:hypothetical protein